MPRKHAAKKRAVKKRPAPPADDTLRLQRLLAAAGFGSRRKCEELIEQGRVDVDGSVVTKLGTTVDPAKQKVRVDGVLLKKQKLVYYAINKPVGVVTTNRDPHGRPRVVDLAPPDERVFAVGRLDRSSEGLILLTNDGELAQRLTHPKFGVRKVYRVTVAGKVDTHTMKQMRKGIYIAEGLVRVDGARLLKTRSRATEMEIVLREGKNREIRRILASLGHKVQRLRRIAVGPLRLGELPTGACRKLTRDEVNKLWNATEVSAESEPTGRPAKKRPAKKRSAKRGPVKGRATKRRATPANKKAGPRAGRGAQPSAAIEGSQRTGAVIGGDDSGSSEAPARPQRAKRRGAKGATGKRRSTARSADGKRSAAGKRSGKADARSGKPARSANKARSQRGGKKLAAKGKRPGSKPAARRGKKR